jgi:hypothetical protein
MIYVVIGILLVLAVGAGLMFLVSASTKDAAPFASEPDSPAGDTGQHAGEQESGRTVTANDQHGGATGERTEGARRFKRDPVGGEAEGEPTIEAGPVERPHRS